MLSTNYGHEPLSGDSFDNNQGQMLHSSSAPLGTSNSENNSGMKGTESASANAARSLRIKPQPNQVLKCPRCHSMNTKFCYYNNYSLTQPRHFCKNCRRYWTKGGALRNVPVGGGCRKNKRAKQKNASESPQSIAQMEKNGLTGSFSSDSLVGSLNQQENNLLDGCSTSNLFSYQQQGEDDPVGLSYRMNHGGHGLGLADYSSFPIPRSMQISGPPPFAAHLGLQGFESGLAGLNFNPSALKHAHASVYDPSSTLSLLSAAASTPPPLSESLSGYGAMNLDGFVALGLQPDSKWKLHHKLAPNMLDSDRSQDHSMVLQGLQLNNVAGLDPKSKSEMLGLSNSEGMNNGTHGVSDWQAPSHDGFMETSADSGYWPPHSWPQIDLPVYSSEAAHQFCDVKPPSSAAAAPDPDFYSRASRCSI